MFRHTWMILWFRTPFTNSRPIRRTLPSMRRLTAVAAFSRALSSTSARASYCPLAPSNSSWHVFSSTRRKAMGLPGVPSSAGAEGNSGTSLLRRRHSSA